MTKRLILAMVAVVALVLIAHDVPLANELETIEPLESLPRDVVDPQSDSEEDGTDKKTLQ